MSSRSTTEVPPPGGHLETKSSTRNNGTIDREPGHGRLPGFPHHHAEAALANHDVRRYLGDPDLRHVWTEQDICRHPTVRVVFEYVHVIGGPGESLACGVSEGS